MKYTTHCGCIPGGRAGTKYRDFGTVAITDDVDETYRILEDENAIEQNMLPNDPAKDIPDIIFAVKNGEYWIGLDVFGEGIIGFGPDIKELENRVRKYFLEEC